jgi:hypothetical protein
MTQSAVTRARLLAVTLLATCAGLAVSAPANGATSTSTGYGFESLSVVVVPRPGFAATQAGSHPLDLHLNFDLNNTPTPESTEATVTGGETRDLIITLPHGMVGNPTGIPQCPQALLDTSPIATCPVNTEVGEIVAGLGNTFESGGFQLTIPIYNMVPPPGVPAEFAFDVSGVSGNIDANVGTMSEGYPLKIAVHDVAERGIVYAHTTIFGVPSEHVEGGSNKPLLTMPTSCGGPLVWHFAADTWQNPGVWAEDEAQTPAITGCEALSFLPSLSVTPEEHVADTPTGVNASLSVPPEGLLRTKGLAGANIQGTTVTLPAGLVANPGQAPGLEFCQPAQAAIDVASVASSCPPASQIGSAEITTPLLSTPLSGGVYLLPSNPPNLEVLVAASGVGVNLKLIGKAQLDPLTGRITTTFASTPDLPVSSLKLHFASGPAAVVDTPLKCGGYETSADLTPWASPSVADVFDTSAFSVDAGPNGTSCAESSTFSPSLVAGSRNASAGGYTDLTVDLRRPDGQQRIASLQTTLPAGAAAVIGSVPECPEPAASQGTCPAQSQIGHAMAVAGPGQYPLVLPLPGGPPIPVYLTGPYQGAPFGLSIVTPLVVGPFNLGTRVVRARINVDSRTGRVTVTTDATGPYAIPQIVDGVPTDVRQVDVTIDRAKFAFNPTNCGALSVTGAASSAEGAITPLSSPFKVAGCRSLPFKPTLSVTTSSHTSRLNGTSLDARLTFPAGSFSTTRGERQSNIASVKVDLPKQLPSRDSTLKKACLAATFDANPAQCPVESRVGIARASTPALPVKLEGPAFLVSHGGAKFPDLVIVLQGDGVRVDLVAATEIHKGVTSSIFRAVPDLPVSSFELYLPKGRFSVLGSFGNLCKAPLTMPTAFTAQNGAVIHTASKIAVTGCPAAKTATKTKGKA